ncbi:MAG TPA: MEDS domain-containing protein [Dehalococcoidia bacterium]|jgi:hypothetical protein|nr:MEDS domain-containing protein [Dehalococcoidia bacterium]
MPELNLSLDRGGHACHLFRDFSDQKGLVLPFFKRGLRDGEYCIYITAEQSVDDWCFEFQAYGVDVLAERERGALDIITGDAWYSGGDFNSVIKARDAWKLIQDHLLDFSGVRIAGDAAWALSPTPLPVSQLCHWEATANLVYEDMDVRAVCQYDLNRHSPAAIHSALRTHQTVVMDGQCYTNPSYEATRILRHEPGLNDSKADARLVEELLSKLTPVN